MADAASATGGSEAAAGSSTCAAGSSTVVLSSNAAASAMAGETGSGSRCGPRTPGPLLLLRLLLALGFRPHHQKLINDAPHGERLRTSLSSSNLIRLSPIVQADQPYLVLLREIPGGGGGPLGDEEYLLPDAGVIALDIKQGHLAQIHRFTAGLVDPDTRYEETVVQKGDGFENVGRS